MRNAAIHRQMGKELLYLFLSHGYRVTLPVKKNETPDPMNIGALGGQPVMTQANGVPHAVHQFRFLHADLQKHQTVSEAACEKEENLVQLCKLSAN